MYSSKLIKSLLVPGAALVAEQKLKQEKQTKPNLCRPSDLPIYVPEQPLPAQEPPKTIPNSLENGFATVRQEVTKIVNEVSAYQRVGLDYLEQSRDNADWLIKYLRQEDNITPKAGAIAIGGLTGLIFGLRGGFFKRTLYSTTGALGMAALCYPKEASKYSQIAITEGRKYATIAYNFVYGGGEAVTQVKQTEDATSAAEITEVDAGTIVSKVHESSSRSCHCPVGACLGHHDESPTS